MVWLIILNITQLFDFDFVDLHSFSYISNAYIAHMYLFTYIYVGGASFSPRNWMCTYYTP